MEIRATFLLVGLLGSAPVTEAAVPVVREVYRETVISTPGRYARPIGAIEFSSDTVEGRRLGTIDYPVHRVNGVKEVILYDDGSVRGSSQQLRHDKWGRVCRTIGNVTACNGSPEPRSPGSN